MELVTGYDQEELLREYWRGQLDEEKAGHGDDCRFRVVEFVSRRRREVTFVKEGERTVFYRGKGGLQPVAKCRGSFIVDDLLNETETLNADDALDKLRRRC